LCKERNIARDSEEGKDRLVRVDWGYEESSEVSGCLWGMEVGAICKLFDLVVGKPQNLIYVFESIRITTQ
jgi:hypothetical protein